MSGSVVDGDVAPVEILHEKEIGGCIEECPEEFVLD